MKIFNLSYRDPNGNPASAYIVRAWFDDNSSSDGLYCANNKELKKHCPEKNIVRFELLEIDAGIKNEKPVI